MSRSISNAPFGLRMPEVLRARVKEMAEENRRSMNSEIVFLLERAAFDHPRIDDNEPPSVRLHAAN